MALNIYTLYKTMCRWGSEKDCHQCIITKIYHIVFEDTTIKLMDMDNRYDNIIKHICTKDNVR